MPPGTATDDPSPTINTVTINNVTDRGESELPTFADDGTDLTVIRWMLAKTPEQRLRWLQAHMQAVHAIRRANS